MKRILLLSFIIVCLISRGSAVQAQTYFSAFLSTTEEQLANPASSVGYGTFELSADRKSLHYELMIWSISDVEAAHFHIGGRGVNGPVVYEFQFPDKRSSVGTWTSTDDLQPLLPEYVDSLMAGKMYVNVHTLLNSGGETRGQLFQPQTFYAFATGAQETPPNASTGTAAAMFFVDVPNQAVYYRGSAMGMTSKITEAHIHNGLPGQAGPVVEPTPMTTTSTDSLDGYSSAYWTSTDAQNPLTPLVFIPLSQNALYWNVHTVNFPAGEVRGQIGRTWNAGVAADTGMWFVALMSGPQEGAAAQPSNAVGTAYFWLSPDGKTLKMRSYHSDLSGPVTGGHIHYGWAGTVPNNGNNVIKPFELSDTMTWSSTDADFPLTKENVDSLFAGYYYINLHTTAWPEGEIRGQIIPVSQPSQSLLAVRQNGGEPAFTLEQNYPNPFNPQTSIRYELPSSGVTSLEVVNALGEKVATLASGMESAGEHLVQWNADNMPSGVYYIVLNSNGATKRISTVLSK